MQGKKIGGRYQIIRHLGGGGFGRTFLAEDWHLPGKPQCVVKQLKPRMTEARALQEARRLFDTEAEVLYLLGSHDQIPRLFAHFEENQEFYLVQEYVEGEILSQEIKTNSRFSEAEVTELLHDILSTLSFVHQQKVVHRDIKPSNLIRRRSDRKLVLIDFGAVKQISTHSVDPDDQISITIAVGSSGYMPNEQLAGKPRLSSDVYAVGMLAIQVLTGIYPKKLREDPKTSEVLWRDHAQVSPALADIIDVMVRYDFRQRYQSATEALQALKAVTGRGTATPTYSLTSDGYLVWLERGDELFQAERYREAVASYDRVIQTNPEEYIAWFKRGIALENLQRYDEASDSYDRVVQLQPDDYLAWLKRGKVLENLQRYDEAARAYEQVAQLQPDNYWAWHDWGRMLEQLQQPDQAIAAYERAVQLKPDFQLAVESRKNLLSQLQRVDQLYHLQHYDEALAACDRAIQLNPDDSLAWFMQGMALDNLQQYEAAIAAYDQVVRIQPDDYLAWFKRGAALENLHRDEEAVDCYIRVVQIQPENYWAWHDRGRVLERLQHYEQALAAYDRVLQLKSDLQSALEGRKRVLQILNQSSPEGDAPSKWRRGVLAHPVELMAEEDETVVSNPRQSRPETLVSDTQLLTVVSARTVPSRPSPHQEDTLVLPTSLTVTVPSPERSPGLSSLPSAIALSDDDEEGTILPGLGGLTVVPTRAANVPLEASPAETVVDDVDETCVVQPTQAEADSGLWFRKGRALEKVQRYIDAIAAYDQSIRLNPTDPEVWRWRGNVLYTLGRYEAAISTYDSALKLQPNHLVLWCCRGNALVKLKRYKEAVACFNRAIQIQPGNHYPWYWRGRLLAELKQYSEAIAALNRAVSLKPGFQPALDDLARLQQRSLEQVSGQSGSRSAPDDLSDLPSVESTL